MSSAVDRLTKRASAKQTPGDREIHVPLDKVRFDPTQPRKAFHMLDGRVAEDAEQYIEELANSIKANGLIQAITVQEVGDGTYLVVVGECRTRAHLKLGLPNIRAIVRNDLTNASRRLVYQVAENVNRMDLSDEELADSIRLLMESGNDGKPMSQVEIAGHLGKSEGWVSRFVKFGDEELQRVWVKSGIADTVEKVYRLSILPKWLQVDILRRVELPEGHHERLEKPLNRNVIDELAREAKLAKRSEPSSKAAPVDVAPPTVTPMETGAGGNEDTGSGGVSDEDAISRALREAASGKHSEFQSKPASEPTSSIGAGNYTLSDEARAKLLGGAQEYANASLASRDLTAPPVNCRISLRNLEALLATVQEDESALDSIRGLRCDVSFPGELAKLIANKLVGVIVDDQEVPAVVQTELSKLG